MNCSIHGDALIHEPGGDDMPTIHGRRYCPTCQAEVMAALTCATCDLMDDGLPCEYHRGFADGAAVVGQERDHCAAANERAERWKARAEKNGYMALAAEKRADAAEGALRRVEALANAAKRAEATSLSRTFDGGTFGAWVSADEVLAALTGADQ